MGLKQDHIPNRRPRPNAGREKKKKRSKVGQKQKTEKKEEGRERERLNDGNNNGQATHGARKPPGPKKALFMVVYRGALVPRTQRKKLIQF